MTSGFTAVYLFGYCIHYFVSKLEIHGAASTFLYFGYTFIIVFLFFLLTGETLGSFIHSIYLHLSIQFIYIYPLCLCSSQGNYLLKKEELYPKFIYHLNFYQNTHANYFSFDCFLGTIGFFACFWFVTKIYGVVKVD